MTGRRRWRVRLAAAAESDVRDILKWTADRFGGPQARVYARTLAAAVGALADGPCPVGMRRRDDIAPGLMTIHVGRSGHKGRHFLLYREGPPGEPPVVEVLRVLHDAMDPRRHLAADAPRA